MTHEELDQQAQLFQEKIKKGTSPEEALKTMDERVLWEVAELKAFLEKSQEKYPEFVAFFKSLPEQQLWEFLAFFEDLKAVKLAKSQEQKNTQQA